jgi:hypothetical protein
MKFGNPFNKVALTTGTFVVALMTGLGTVNAGEPRMSCLTRLELTPQKA